LIKLYELKSFENLILTKNKVLSLKQENKIKRSKCLVYHVLLQILVRKIGFVDNCDINRMAYDGEIFTRLDCSS